MRPLLSSLIILFLSISAFAQKKEKKERSYYSPASINRENYIKQNGKWVTKPELYSIKQNDPNCVPKLLIGYGLGLTGLEFAGYLDLYALYELPKIGTLTFNQQLGINSKKFGGQFPTDEYGKEYGFKLGLYQSQLALNVPVFNKMKKKVQGVPIEIIGYTITTNSRTGTTISPDYLVARVPSDMAVSYAVRGGLIQRSSIARMSLNDHYVDGYKQTSLFVGLSKIRKSQLVIDYAGKGLRQTKFRTLFYMDIMYGFSQRPNAFSQVIVGDQYTFEQVIVPGQVQKIPYGFRLGYGVEYYHPKRRWSNGLSFEVGQRPTYIEGINGLYAEVTANVTFGFLAPAQQKVDGDIPEDSYFDSDKSEKKTDRFHDQKKKQKLSVANKYKKRSWLGKLFHGKKSQKKVKNRFG